MGNSAGWRGAELSEYVTSGLGLITIGNLVDCNDCNLGAWGIPSLKREDTFRSSRLCAKA